jgi:superfamily I DNA/RNA helicase
MGKVRAHILPIARRVWEDAKDKNGNLPFTHDYYLKMWALSNPNLHVSFLLYDEAQDANPCIAGVVLGQRAFGTQVIMVGDSAQAIYGWRGAVNAMADFAAEPGVTTLLLSQSFRFGQAIADEANKWLSLIEAPLRLTGFAKIESRVASVEVPDAILCRTNAECIAQALSHQAEGLRVAIVGGTKEIKKMAEAAIELQAGRQPFHAEFALFKTWADFIEYVAEDGDASLKVFVNLVTNYGAEQIIEVCDASVDEAKADVVVSTAHKAKGREWNHVRIASDFREPNKDEGQVPAKAEMMLAYVAVTRAKITLDNDGLAWVNSWV